jgi:PKD repeat protein
MKKLLRPILSLCLSAVLVIPVTAQRKYNPDNTLQSTPLHRCSTHEKMMELKAQDPDFDNKRIAEEQKLQNWISKNYQQFAAKKAILTIPVVVQIFGTTPNNAVTDNRVYEQLDVLNKDFRRLNSDTNKTPGAFKSVSADCEIEFCLATKDPQGNTTTGIVRKTGSNSPTNGDLWTPSQYLNILVYSIGGGTLGFTYLPSQAPNNGVHIGYQYFGKTGASAPYNLGRTATHEVGHWFNLEHIWGDDNGACTGSDQVSDTPNQANSTGGCPSFPKTDNCSPNSPGIMFMNYMDYSNDNCMNMFTAGQKARMIAAINTYRPGLLNNGKCGTVAPTLKADFTSNFTTITEGNSVNFNDLSTGSPTTWAWTFTGGTPASSTSQNPTNIVYNVAGTYAVKLKVTNASAQDSVTKSSYITVLPAGSQLCDTLSNFKPNNTATLYGVSVQNNCNNAGWGYLSGHNCYDDRAKVDRFAALPGGYTLSGVQIYFGAKHDGSGSSTIDINVWNESAGKPGSIVATKTVPISSLQLYPNPTMITFTNPVSVTGPYYVGMAIKPNGTPQDTVAIITNTDPETSPGTAWEQFDNGSWYAYSDATNSWGVNVAHAIYPIRCSNGTPCPNIVVSVTNSVNATCGGSNGSATVSAANGATPYTYNWSNNKTGATVTGLAAGTYTVTATDNDGCTGTGTITITGSSAPNVSVTTVAETSQGACNGSATANPTGGTPPYTYQWAASAANQTTKTATGLCAGAYSVTVTDANGCTKAATGTVAVGPNGIATNGLENKISVYPNPSQGNINIDFSLNESSDVVITVFNVIGEQLHTLRKEAIKDINLNVDLSSYAKGLYFVEIKTNNGTVLKKINIIQ